MSAEKIVRERDPYHLETLHPLMWANIQFLRKLADELEYGTRFSWHVGKCAERKTTGWKHVKFTGDIELRIRLYDSEIAGKLADDTAPDWSEWWK